MKEKDQDLNEQTKQVRAVLKKHLGASNVEKALKALSELSELQVASQEEYEQKNNVWWNKLSQTEREDAFYAVCKRIYKADIVDQGSYRYALYDIFNFEPGMYGLGMDCGYMTIHNTLYDGKDLQRMRLVNRIEIIDESGRVYTKMLQSGEGVDFSLQDDERTLKIFVDKESWTQKV
jgi:hypothetical protein